MFYNPYYWNYLITPLIQQNPRTPSTCPPGFQRYTVSQGDSIYRVAQRFGISVNELIVANPHISNPNILFIGDVLCVPTQCPPGTERYIVQPGDTMIKIAQRFRITLEALIEANPQIENPNLITPGDVICVPAIGRPLLPCCIYLSIRELDARGSAFFEEFGRLGQYSVGILIKDLPSADEFGNFDTYIAQIIVPDVNTFETELNSVVNEPTLLAGREVFELPEGMVDLSALTSVYIRPFNSETNETGPVVLQGSLREC